MKKVLILIIALVLIISTSTLLISCNNNEEKSEITINVAMPDGTTVLAIGEMFNNFTTFETKTNKYKINYEIVAGASEISAKISTGQADIAIAPTNLVAKLYKKGVSLGLIASNVFGALYIIGDDNITTIAQLADKKIACTGQAGTPDYIMQYVLSNNGLSVNNLDITYVSQGSEALAMLSAGTADVAVVGEPIATNAEIKNKASIIFDLQEEYKKITNKSGYPQASTIAKTDLIANHEEFLDAFLDKMEANLEYISNTDTSSITTLIQNAGSAVTYPNTTAIINSNLKVVRADDVKDEIVEYFTAMATFNSDFFGGSMPEDAFYAQIG